MYETIAALIILFWFLGLVTGTVTVIFLLRLEDRYLFEPPKTAWTKALRAVTDARIAIRRSLATGSWIPRLPAEQQEA